jgi:hypothetical protein
VLAEAVRERRAEVHADSPASSNANECLEMPRMASSTLRTVLGDTREAGRRMSIVASVRTTISRNQFELYVQGAGDGPELPSDQYLREMISVDADYFDRVWSQGPPPNGDAADYDVLSEAVYAAFVQHFLQSAYDRPDILIIALRSVFTGYRHKGLTPKAAADSFLTSARIVTNVSAFAAVDRLDETDPRNVRELRTVQSVLPTSKYDSRGFDHEGWSSRGYDRNGFYPSGRNLFGQSLSALRHDFETHLNTQFEDRSADSFVALHQRGSFDKRIRMNKFGYMQELAESYRSVYNGFRINLYTQTLFDLSGFDFNGLDRAGFNRGGFYFGDLRLDQGTESFQRGIHRDTRTKNDPDGFDFRGLNEEGYDSAGLYWR